MWITVTFLESYLFISVKLKIHLLLHPIISHWVLYLCWINGIKGCIFWNTSVRKSICVYVTLQHACLSSIRCKTLYCPLWTLKLFYPITKSQKPVGTLLIMCFVHIYTHTDTHKHTCVCGCICTYVCSHFEGLILISVESVPILQCCITDHPKMYTVLEQHQQHLFCS